MARRGGGILNRFKKGYISPENTSDMNAEGKNTETPNAKSGFFGSMFRKKGPQILSSKGPEPQRNNTAFRGDNPMFSLRGSVNPTTKNKTQTNPGAEKPKVKGSTSSVSAMRQGYGKLNNSTSPATGPIPGKKIFNGKPVNARIGSTQGVSPPPVPTTLANATATALFPPLTPSKELTEKSENAYGPQGQSSKTSEVVETAETPVSSTPINKAYNATGSVQHSVATKANNLTKSSWVNKVKARMPSMPKVSMPSISKPNFLKKKDAAYYINRIEELKKELDPVKSQNKKPYIGSIYNNYVKLLNFYKSTFKTNKDRVQNDNAVLNYENARGKFIAFINEYPIIDPTIVVGGKIRDIRTFFPKFYKPANDDLVKYIQEIHTIKTKESTNNEKADLEAIYKNYMKIKSVFERFRKMMNEPKLKSLQIYSPLIEALREIYIGEEASKIEKEIDENRRKELEKEALDELPKKAKDRTIGVGVAAEAEKPVAEAEKPALTMTQAEMDAVMGAVKQASAPVPVPAPAQAQVSIPDKMTLFFDLLKQNKIHYLNIFGSIFYLSKLYKNKNIQPALYKIDKFKEMFQVSEDALCGVLKAFAPVFGIEKADFKSQASKVDVDLKLGASAEDDALMIEHLTHYRSFLDQRASINAYTKTDNRANEARIAKIDGYIRFLELGLGDRVTVVPGLTCSEADLQKSYIASQGPAPASAPAQGQGKSLTALETVALVQSLLQKQPKSDCGDCKEVTAIQTLLKHMIAKGNKNATKNVSNSVDNFLKGDEKALETLLELLDRTNPRPVIVSEESKEDAEQNVVQGIQTIDAGIDKLSAMVPSEMQADVGALKSTIESIQADVEKLKEETKPADTQAAIQELYKIVDDITTEYGNKDELLAKIRELESKQTPTLQDFNQLKNTVSKIEFDTAFTPDILTASLTKKIDELAARVTASEQAEATAKEDADTKITKLTQQLEALQTSTEATTATSAQQSQEAKAAQDAIIAGLKDEIANLRAGIAALTAAQQQTPIVQPDEIRKSIMEILERNYAKKNAIPDMSVYATKGELGEYAKKTDLDTLATKVGTEEFTNTIAELRQQIATLGAKTSLDQSAVERIIDGAVEGRFKKIEGDISSLQNMNGLYSELKKGIVDLNAAMADKTLALEKIRGEMTAVISKQAAEQQAQLQAAQTEMQATQGAVDGKLQELATKTGSLGLRVDTLSRDQVTKTELQSLADQLAAKQGEIDGLKAQIDEKMRECAECKASIDERIAALKTELAATQVPVKVEEVANEGEKNTTQKEQPKPIELPKLESTHITDYFTKFYKSASKPQNASYDEDDNKLINFFGSNGEIIKAYITTMRPYNFSAVKVDEKEEKKVGDRIIKKNKERDPKDLREFFTTVINKQEKYKTIYDKSQKIIYGLFKIFVEYVNLVDEKDFTKELHGSEKEESVFLALKESIGEDNLRKIFSNNPNNLKSSKEILDKLRFNLRRNEFLGNKYPSIPILGQMGTTDLTDPIPPLQLKAKRGGALNRTIEDVVFELLARIQTEPSMSEAAIDELLMEYGVDVGADVTAVEKITGTLNFMRELYDI